MTVTGRVFAYLTVITLFSVVEWKSISLIFGERMGDGIVIGFLAVVALGFAVDMIRHYPIIDRKGDET
jgi:predicted histidine transporter YuiF (NhaC family)